jgi:hypothetical protein
MILNVLFVGMRRMMHRCTRASRGEGRKLLVRGVMSLTPSPARLQRYTQLYIVLKTDNLRCCDSATRSKFGGNMEKPVENFPLLIQGTAYRALPSSRSESQWVSD